MECVLSLRTHQAKKDEISFFNMPECKTYEETGVNNLGVFIEEIYDLLKLSHPTKGEIVLDAGCGSGAWGLSLAKKGYVVVGVDISKMQIKQAQEKASSDNLSFMPILCDLERLPLRAQTFQLCICGYVLHHFRNLDDISRILNPQGSVFIVDPNGSNAVHTVVRNIMIFFPKSWVMEKGIATSNESAHEIKFYLRALKKTNFDSIHYGLRNANVPKHSHFNLFVALVFVRSTFLEICKRLLPDFIGKTEVVLKASSRIDCSKFCRQRKNR
jgi:ubiquinone/menaquinone biosynthesis C-methylase UbiE